MCNTLQFGQVAKKKDAWNLQATVQKEATVLVLRATQTAATFFAFYASKWPLFPIHTLKSAMPVTKCVRNLICRFEYLSEPKRCQEIGVVDVRIDVSSPHTCQFVL
jgi:hypothetical protein